MTKFDKEIGTPSPADRRRMPAPERAPKKSRRRRNFEHADAALRDRIERAKQERGRSWLEAWLPENAGARKERDRKIRALKCACGHRGDKHKKWVGIGEYEIGRCRVCHDCEMLAPVFDCIGVDPGSVEGDFACEVGGTYDENGALHITEISVVKRR